MQVSCAGTVGRVEQFRSGPVRFRPNPLMWGLPVLELPIVPLICSASSVSLRKVNATTCDVPMGTSPRSTAAGVSDGAAAACAAKTSVRTKARARVRAGSGRIERPYARQEPRSLRHPAIRLDQGRMGVSARRTRAELAHGPLGHDGAQGLSAGVFEAAFHGRRDAGDVAG